MYPILVEDGLDSVQVQLRLWNHGLHVDPSLVLLLEDDVGRVLVQPDPEALQLPLQDLLVPEGLQNVEDDEDEVGGPRHGDNLPPSTLSVLGALDDTRQIKQLDLCALQQLGIVKINAIHYLYVLRSPSPMPYRRRYIMSFCVYLV